MADPLTISADTVNIVGGYVPDVLILQQEELSTPGQDGRNWRDVNRQYREFTVVCTKGFSSRADARSEAKDLLDYIGSVSDLSFGTAGVAQGVESMGTVHVNSVECFVGGPFVAGGGSYYTHHCRSVWRLESVSDEAGGITVL